MASAVTESALMAALSFLFFWAANFPVLGFLWLLCPLPLTVVAKRHGMKRAILSCLCATALVCLITGGPLQGYLYLMPCGVLGLITGWMVRQEGPAWRSLLAGTIVMLLTMAPGFTILAKSVGLQDSLGETKKMYFQLIDTVTSDMTSPVAREQIGMLKQWVTTLLACPVALLFFGSLSLVYANHLLSYKALKRLDMPVRPPPDPRRFHLSLWMIPFMLACKALILKAAMTNSLFAISLGMNLDMICSQICLLGGVAAVGRMLRPEELLSIPKFLCVGFVSMFLMPIPILVGFAEAAFGPLSTPATPPDKDAAATAETPTLPQSDSAA